MNPLDLAAKFVPVWFRPWMAWAAIVAVLLGLLGFQTVRLAGAKAEHARVLQAHAEAMEKAQRVARETENGLRADLDQLQADAAKEKENAERLQADLIERVRTGERRLSIPAVCPTGTGFNSSASGGGGAGVPRADIDPAAAARIIGITGDGDQYIRERNACVEAYEKVRARLNALSARP